MGNKLRIYSTALAAIALVLFLILISSTATAAPLTITETRITTSGSASNPDIYENKIVWQDTRDGGSDIYMYDLSTMKETQITTSGSAYNPAIYGNLIVYEKHGMNYPDDPWHSSDIYMYNIATQQEAQIPTSIGAFNPDVYGSKIVWDGGGIYLYDLSNAKVTKIAEDWYNNDEFAGSGSQNRDPVIYGNQIAWYGQDYTDVDTFYSIYLYDLSTDHKTEIASIMNDYLGLPDIYDDEIVYTTASIYQIGTFIYQISTQKISQITTSETVSSPHIYGNRIIWQDNRNGNWDIYMYDLCTSTETQTTTSGSAVNPVIYNDRIVWEDSRNGGSDIYMATLSSSNLPETVEAEIYFSPNTLNLRSGGQWVTVYIELPEEYAATGIDVSSVLLNGAVSAVTDMKCNFVTDKREYLTDVDRDGISERMLKFDRKAIGSVLKKGNKVTITLTGRVEYNDGISSSVADFKGSGVIKVIESKSKK